ncbi:MAG: hypothetical protein ACMV1K_13435 [Sulfurospirillum sp.]
MLKDVIKLTTRIYNEILNESHVPLSAISLYDSYRKLGEVIENTHLVANHYLALRFDEGFLQNSSFGEPIDKWHYFFNQDLERLNSAVKSHLIQLQGLGIQDPQNPDDRIFILDTLFYVKSYYTFVRDHYNAGYLNRKATHISCNVLITKYDNQTVYISEGKSIDVSTYEKRCELKALLLTKLEKLRNLHQRLGLYLKEHYTLNDLIR